MSRALSVHACAELFVGDDGVLRAQPGIDAATGRPGVHLLRIDHHLDDAKALRAEAVEQALRVLSPLFEGGREVRISVRADLPQAGVILGAIPAEWRNNFAVSVHRDSLAESGAAA